MIDQASIEAVVTFRDEFVKFTSDAMSSYRPGGLRSYIDRSAIPDFRSRQDALNERYGELYALINASGTTQMTMPAIGVISHDVVQDAINDLDDSNYTELVEGARQHLSRSIGALRRSLAEDKHNLEEKPSDQEAGGGPTAGSPPGRTVELPITSKRLWAVATSIVIVTAGAVTLFVTVFGADWANVQRNWNEFLRWLPF